MPTFKDADGRDWNLTLTLGVARRIKDDLGIDFGAIGDGSLFFKLAGDPYKLGAVLWLLIEREAERRKITDEQFLDALDGDVLGAAISALGEAVVNFTPAPMRAAVAKAFAKTEEAQQVAMTTLMDWMDQQDLKTQTEAKTKELILTYGAESSN